MAAVKLSVWAKNNGIKSRTAWFQFRAGKVPGARQLATGTIVVDLPETEATRPELGVVITCLEFPRPILRTSMTCAVVRRLTGSDLTGLTH